MTALTRRSLLGTTGAAAATIGLGDLALAGPAGYDSIPAWIDRSARPLMHLDSAGPDLDLHPLRRIVGSARMVGLGESSHTTDSLFVLKHRVARFLVERMGFRTVAWEETWGSGALIDRYVTGRGGDPRDIAAQASYNLQHLALLDLIEWMRDFNRGRPAGDQVRFLGADVTQLRGVQFTELTTYVDDVAPEQSERLATHLRPLQIQGDPGSHIGWYLGLDQAEQEVLVEQARAVERLVRGLPRGQSSVSRRDAEMHAFALLGFYHANTHEGGRQDLRDRYIADILDRWLRMSARPVVYSAANAHTVAAPRQIVSFPDPWSPPDQWVTERSLAGGLLRERYGADYVSIGTTFDHGTILSG